jgi:hypothetical protein
MSITKAEAAMDTQTIIRRIMDELDDNRLYTAGALAIIARDSGILDDNEQLYSELQRVRIRMGRLANMHNFPPRGDGELESHSVPVAA